REACAGPLKGVLSITDEPLVSCDFKCTDQSSTIDASLTMVMGDDMVKVGGWAAEGGVTRGPGAQGEGVEQAGVGSRAVVVFCA
ncbi:MAG: hypothetical protein ACT6SA_15755, partial [Aeromicrobium sp.]